MYPARIAKATPSPKGDGDFTHFILGHDSRCDLGGNERRTGVSSLLNNRVRLRLCTEPSYRVRYSTPQSAKGEIRRTKGTTVLSKTNQTQPYKLPKGTLSRIVLAHSFAEYDPLLDKPGVFVETPAARAANDPSQRKCIFVGRRGSGKTAINLHISNSSSSLTQKSVVQLYPKCLTSIRHGITIEQYADTRQRPFHLLVLAFKYALALEAAGCWIAKGVVSQHSLPDTLVREKSRMIDLDFDSRVLDVFEEVEPTLSPGQDKHFFKCFRKLDRLLGDFQLLPNADRSPMKIVIDKVDDDWDGSDESVVVLMALMHACVELTSAVRNVRPLLFLRENLFERVRRIDNEFPRLETSVASLDWTKELLSDLVARRFQYHLNPKPPVSQIWGAFFQDQTESSICDQIFDYCQYRPRDVLVYLFHAIEASKGSKHEQITVLDLDAAKKVFSENRLKDLGNEYSENYPNIHQVLARFHGLARRFTVGAITDLIKKLLVDPVIKAQCATWMYSFTAPHQFIELLYGIGFVGILTDNTTTFRGSGVKESAAPHIDTANTIVVVHPSYVHALDLQDSLAMGLDTSTPLQTDGSLIELPDAISPIDYQSKLKEMQEQLITLSTGDSTAGEYQDLVGEIVKYCFFHTLLNPRKECNDVDGRVRRDWIFSNRAGTDFWRMIQEQHKATQVIWECKNYEDLSASDFHQLSYYLNKDIGTFVIVSCRGDEWDKPHYYQHIRRISALHGGAMVVILCDSDLKAFLRQASKGHVKDGLLRDRYDTVKQKIS